MTKSDAILSDFLDHVGIRVKDMANSTQWYLKVLDSKKYKLQEWGGALIFMFSGKSGISLFPANTDDVALDQGSKNVKIDHFAFNVNRDNFQKALERYQELGLECTVKEHQSFDSVHTQDPDVHMLELTTLKVDSAEF